MLISNFSRGRSAFSLVSSQEVQEMYDPRPKLGGHRILKKLTLNYAQTLTKCNPHFQAVRIPQRFLTFPNIGTFNHGYDNEEYEYILKVHDIIEGKENYVIEDLLGRGTFGQVVKCRRGEHFFALKIIKNQEVYNYQAVQEMKVLRKINNFEDKCLGQPKIVKLVDQFVFRNHVCLVFTLHHINLFEFLQETKFEGLSMQFIQHVMRELLEGVDRMHRIGIIHGDLKPENVLLDSKENHSIKIIDLGSALTGEESYFEYIQSLFYRAPEVIVGETYTPALDIWSIGCIAAELFLGQPLLAGSSSLDQLTKILSLVPMQSEQDLEGASESKFLVQGCRVKTFQEFEEDTGQVLPRSNNQRYKFRGLQDLVHEFDKSSFRTPDQMCFLDDFIDFLVQTLTLNPFKRITAEQALNHRFIKIRVPSLMLSVFTPPKSPTSPRSPRPTGSQFDSGRKGIAPNHRKVKSQSSERQQKV